jgi:hypothetical protein
MIDVANFTRSSGDISGGGAPIIVLIADISGGGAPVIVSGGCAPRWTSWCQLDGGHRWNGVGKPLSDAQH